MSDALKCQVCQKPSRYQCSQCILVSYCSLECQKLDWSKHSRNCKKPCKKKLEKPEKSENVENVENVKGLNDEPVRLTAEQLKLAQAFSSLQIPKTETSTNNVSHLEHEIKDTNETNETKEQKVNEPESSNFRMNMLPSYYDGCSQALEQASVFEFESITLQDGTVLPVKQMFQNFVLQRQSLLDRLRMETAAKVQNGQLLITDIIAKNLTIAQELVQKGKPIEDPRLKERLEHMASIFAENTPMGLLVGFADANLELRFFLKFLQQKLAMEGKHHFLIDSALATCILAFKAVQSQIVKKLARNEAMQ